MKKDLRLQINREGDLAWRKWIAGYCRYWLAHAKSLVPYGHDRLIFVNQPLRSRGPSVPFTDRARAWTGLASTATVASDPEPVSTGGKLAYSGQVLHAASLKKA